MEFEKTRWKLLDNGIEFIFNDIVQLNKPQVFLKSQFEILEFERFYVVKKMSIESQYERIEKKLDKILGILENGRL